MSDLKPILVGEILVFNLVGRLLYEELDRSWLQEIITQDVFAEIPFGGELKETQTGLKLLRRWAEANPSLTEEAFDDLRAENTRLFIGVGKVLAPLWESVYFGEDRLVFQEETLQVRAWYRRFGLEAEKLYNEPDDHIGLEFLFVEHLGRLALEALEQGDESKVEECLQVQRDFLSGHLLRWAPAWTRLVLEHARTDFYRGLAHLAMGTLLAAVEVLKIEMPREPAR